MLKIVSRRNLIYPIYLIIWTFLREIISILLFQLFNFEGSVIYIFLMFLGEIIAGFFIFKYQKNFIERNHIPEIASQYNKFPLIQEKPKMKKADNFKKIYFLVFTTALFDFFEFIISTYYIEKIPNISETLKFRLGGILIIVSSLLYWKLLKFKLFKHQIVSLIVICICIILIIISEYIFLYVDKIIFIKELNFAILLSSLSHIFMAYNNIIEKYLIEFDFLNPFFILFYQGIIGLTLTIILSCIENPFKGIKVLYDNTSNLMFLFFLFLLLLYFLFGALKNIYRMVTIMIFSPMNKNLTDIIINPIYVIYYFIAGEDFIKDGKNNYFYFFVNLILLVLIDISCLIFNEFLILFCCRLDHNTYESISIRALKTDDSSINSDTSEESEDVYNINYD